MTENCQPLKGRITVPGWFTRIFRPGKTKELNAEITRLEQPHICVMPSRKVLVVRLSGYPGEVAGKVWGALFSVYHKLGIGHQIKDSPRARYQVGVFDIARDQIRGEYALPVPDSVKKLPEDLKAVKGLNITLETWEYGQVAEILHVGPYSKEPATIRRLEDYITAQGYRIVGKHEEEYHEGPGQYLKGDPEEYTTLIRFRVEKKGQ